MFNGSENQQIQNSTERTERWPLVGNCLDFVEHCLESEGLMIESSSHRYFFPPPVELENSIDNSTFMLFGSAVQVTCPWLNKPSTLSNVLNSCSACCLV